MPASPSMYVIAERHEAVLTKPGSSVTRPVSFNKFDTSYSSLPSVAWSNGQASSLSPVRRIASAVSILIKQVTSLYPGSIAGSCDSVTLLQQNVPRDLKSSVGHRGQPCLRRAQTPRRGMDALVGSSQSHAHMAPTRRAVKAARRHEDAQIGHLGNERPARTILRRRVRASVAKAV